MSDLFQGFYRERPVLVTGHTGFKGAWLCAWLRTLGSVVIGYALDPPTVPSLFEACCLKQRMISILGDIRDLKRLRGVFETYRPEIVFHLAAQALVTDSFRRPVETFETNVIGTVNLLETCRESSSVRVVVNVTSDKCYENQEWPWGYREIDRLGGHDPYSASKACAEFVTHAYQRSFFRTEDYGKHGKGMASVRAGNVIGGGDWAENRLIPDCLRGLIDNKSILLRNPESIRPWQHVLEPLHGYLLLARRLFLDGTAFSGAWNFGPDSEGAKPVRWVVERLLELWGSRKTWTHDPYTSTGETHVLKLDSSKARSRLGWHTQWTLPEALLKTTQWYTAYYDGQEMLAVTEGHIKAFAEKASEKTGTPYAL
jgi:CDP-glucose 4,6-dehydratase